MHPSPYIYCIPAHSFHLYTFLSIFSHQKLHMDLETLDSNIHMDVSSTKYNKKDIESGCIDEAAELPPPYDGGKALSACSLYIVRTLERLISFLMLTAAAFLYYAIAVDRSLIWYSWCAFGGLDCVYSFLQFVKWNHVDVRYKDFLYYARLAISFSLMYFSYSVITQD